MRKRNVLVVGSGGREHALAWKFSQSSFLNGLFVAPGNGGTEPFNVRIPANDIETLSKFAEENECFTVVGPEVPIASGIADRFRAKALSIFSPSSEQGRLESSKCYAKEFMAENNIPTAKFKVFKDPEKAIDYSRMMDGRVAIKADGLASGKGVIVPSSIEESEKAIRAIMVDKIFGDAGNSIVVEEKLEGREISVMALCDGSSAIQFGAATDHKRLLDGDRGPNTGGMGAYSPPLDFGEDSVKEVIKNIACPVVEKTGFSGFLYLGLMLTDSGMKVLEFNSRLGDPEAQVILPRLEGDLLSDLVGICEEGKRVEDLDQRWSNNSACSVVMCSEGYPSSPKIGDEIKGLDDPAIAKSGSIVFHSGTRKIEGGYVTNGGRVLCVTSLAPTLSEASSRAYDNVRRISWRGENHRSDIGRRAK